MAFEVVEERFRGDTIEFDAFVTREGGPFDLTAVIQVWCTGKLSADLPDAQAVFQKTLGNGIQLLSGPNGVVRVTIEPGDTQNVVITNDGVVNVQCDVAIKMPGAAQWTVKRFVLPLVSDVTRATS